MADPVLRSTSVKHAASPMARSSGNDILPPDRWPLAVHPFDRDKAYGPPIWRGALGPGTLAAPSLDLHYNGASFTVVVDQRPPKLVGKALTVPDKAAAERALGAAIMECLTKEGVL